MKGRYRKIITHRFDIHVMATKNGQQKPIRPWKEETIDKVIGYRVVLTKDAD
jgi:hypothetical protein